MTPRSAKDAAFAIARIMFDKPFPKSYMSLFETIWDEIASGSHTYGKSSWTRFIRVQPKDSDYWYKRVRTMAFAEIARKESYRG